MDPYLETLIPPKYPKDIPTESRQWEAIEKKLGTKFPSDYKDFVALYGTGSIQGHVWVYNPFCAYPYLNLLHVLQAMREKKLLLAQLNDCQKYPFYPAKNGLIPLGTTEAGDDFFWRTEGKPERWRTVIHDAHSNRYRVLKMGFSGFISALLQKRLWLSGLDLSHQQTYYFLPFH